MAGIAGELTRLIACEVEVLRAGPQGRGVDLPETLTVLAERYGVLQALIEGGGRLHGAFVEEHLADRLVMYIAPVLLGERGLPVQGQQAQHQDEEQSRR